MTYPAAQIANKLLDIAARSGRRLTPMQLQKLVYIAHGWYLGHTGQPLIQEDVQAWRYGPVIYDLYKKTKHFGNQPITEWVPTGAMPWDRDKEVEPAIEEFLTGVWHRYAQFDAVQLSNMTHQPDTPWYRKWVEQDGRNEYFGVIENDLICDFYRRAIQSNNGLPTSA